MVPLAPLATPMNCTLLCQSNLRNETDAIHLDIINNLFVMPKRVYKQMEAMI